MGFRIVVSPPWTFVGHLHKISAIWRSREATREVTFIFTRWDQTVFLLGQGDLVALIQHGGEGWREVSSARSRKRFQTGQNLFSIFHRVFAFRAYEIKLANFLRVERQLRTLLLIFGFKITRLVSMSASLKSLSPVLHITLFLIPFNSLNSFLSFYTNSSKCFNSKKKSFTPVSHVDVSIIFKNETCGKLRFPRCNEGVRYPRFT